MGQRTLKFLLFGLILFFCACSPVESGDAEDDSVIDISLNPTSISVNPIEAYPPNKGEGEILDSSYPISSISSYPSPQIIDESKRVTIHTPIKVDAIEVSGTGPPNTPIKIVSISYVGESLGFGIIESDGTFDIKLEKPLELNHVIGVQLSDTGMESEFLDGPGFTSIPLIGLVLDQAIVEE